MVSEIWRVKSEKIGPLEAFKSERDMESFLMNNPAIIGCWDPEVNNSIPALIRSQFPTKNKESGGGRMDLVGIAPTDNGYELRIFELKNVEVTVDAVDQLNGYLTRLIGPDSARDRENLEKRILELGLEDVSENDVKDIVKEPIGILVGPKFKAEAILKAKELKIKGVRLARFRSASSTEYYVIVEDEVGDIVDLSRRNWKWKDLYNSNLITKDDYFVIKHENNALRAKPDLNTWDKPKKKIIFDEESARILISSEQSIRSRATTDHDRWLDKEFSALKKGEGIFLSNAAGICYLAFGGPSASYWVPNPLWIHERTDLRLQELVEDYLKRK